MTKIKEHINLSKNVITCKYCKNLTMVKYLDNKYCEKCDKKYIEILNKIIYQK